jgi:hypothetical protein
MILRILSSVLMIHLDVVFGEIFITSPGGRMH